MVPRQADNSFDSLRTLLNAFRDKYGDKREGKFLVKEFNTIKKKENEMVVEFNQRFNKLLKDMTRDYKPPEKTVLETYLEAYHVEVQYEIRRAHPATFVAAQNTTEELEKDKRLQVNLRSLAMREVLLKSKKSQKQ